MRGLEQIPWLYDLGLALAERGRFGRWRRWLAAGARGLTLDLGTGTGRNLPHAPPGTPLVAVDPSPENLAAARERARGALLVRARAEALPFRAGTFETVLCGLVLCSVDDPAAAVAELGRVLAPGGTVRALEHVRTEGLAGTVQDLVQPGWTWVTGGCRPNRRTEQTLGEAGFVIVPGTRRVRGTMRLLEAFLPTRRGGP